MAEEFRVSMSDLAKEEGQKGFKLGAHHSLAEAAKEVICRIRTLKEHQSEAHKKYRETQKSLQAAHDPPPGFRDVEATGVIYVMGRAREDGYSYNHPAWGNFGQGAPETGDIPGNPERPSSVTFDHTNLEYAPVTGLPQLREAVANLYNVRYRKGKPSQYTKENVCICPGGRAGLTRLAAAFNDVNVGFVLPEYTAYEQMLSVFKHFVPIPFPMDAASGYTASPEALSKEIHSRGLRAFILSNPGNPTGRLIEGETLKKWCDVGRESHCSIIFDEFYSHYIWTHDEESTGRTVSCAEYVEDVNEDPLIIVDGLTKNWRTPGFRVTWVVGPASLIKLLESAGSFLEGGCNHPLQITALPMLDPAYADAETKAIQNHFRQKRQMVLDRIAKLGMKVEVPPGGTFYIWVNLEDLPAPLNNGMGFFEEGLKNKVICVPGLFFDVNPSKRRDLFDSPYHHYIRLSYGPPIDQLERGLDAFDRMVAAARASQL